MRRCWLFLLLGCLRCSRRLLLYKFLLPLRQLSPLQPQQLPLLLQQQLLLV
jgi:hypothetical protein